MKTQMILAPLLALAASGTAHTAQAQMKTATDFERERSAKPAYRIVQQGGQWKIQKPQSMAPVAPIMRRNGLAWSEWELQSPVYAGLQKLPSLKFTDSRLAASVGGNGIGGAFKVDGGSLKLGPLISTRMAPPEPIASAERAYSAALEGVRSWKISPDGQALTLSGASELRFKLTARTPNSWRQTQSKLVRVRPSLGPEMDGDQAPKYLQLEDLTEGTSWGRFTAAGVEDFDFQTGNQYLLKIAVERNERADPPQRLRLLEVVSQKFLGKIVPRPGEEMVEVAPVRVAESASQPEKLLQVRFFGGAEYGQWQALPREIKGFEFEEGSKYRLLIRKAAQSPQVYELVRLLEKMPVTQ